MKFMVCYDGSESSKKALEFAKERARKLNASIVLVTSMIKGRESENKKILKYEGDQEYEQKLCMEEGLVCEIHLLIRGLSAGEDLVEFAKQNAVDEMYIGVKKHSFLGNVLFSSTAQYVVLHAHCPVVTVNYSKENKYLRAA